MKVLLFFLFFLLHSISQAHVWNQIYLQTKKVSDNYQFTIYFDVGYAVPEVRDDPQASPPTHKWLVEQDNPSHLRIRKEAQQVLNSFLDFRINDKPVDVGFLFPDWDTIPPQFQIIRGDDAFITVILITSPQANDSFSLNIKDTPITPKVAIKKLDGSIITLSKNDSINFQKKTDVTSKTATVISDRSPFLQNLKTGFLHVIPEGMDHVLFILAMCLAAKSIKRLLTLSLLFTFCHSLCFAAIYFQWIHLPGIAVTIIEWLILVSIIVMAANNFRDSSSFKESGLLVALFGCIHGLGFANVLISNIHTDIPLMLILAVGAGIELAQLFIIATSIILLLFLLKFLKKEKIYLTANTWVVITAAWLILQRLWMS